MTQKEFEERTGLKLSADGIYVEIEEHVCHAFTFFELVEEAKDGMISETLYIRNCI